MALPLLRPHTGGAPCRGLHVCSRHCPPCLTAALLDGSAAVIACDWHQAGSAAGLRSGCREPSVLGQAGGAGPAGVTGPSGGVRWQGAQRAVAWLKRLGARAGGAGGSSGLGGTPTCGRLLLGSKGELGQRTRALWPGVSGRDLGSCAGVLQYHVLEAWRLAARGESCMRSGRSVAPHCSEAASFHTLCRGGCSPAGPPAHCMLPQKRLRCDSAAPRPAAACSRARGWWPQPVHAPGSDGHAVSICAAPLRPGERPPDRWAACRDELGWPRAAARHRLPPRGSLQPRTASRPSQLTRAAHHRMPAAARGAGACRSAPPRRLGPTTSALRPSQP